MRKRFNTTNSFLDLLFNTLLCFFMLFTIALLLVNTPSKNGDIELKAEFLVTMEWPSGNKDDVDLLLLTPDGDVVFFGNQDGDMASLDRDDQGEVNDTVTLSDGSKHVIEDNWEHIAIRKMVPGKYTVNIFMYNKREYAKTTPVLVKIEKLNPYQLVYAKTIDLKEHRQEETVLSFKLDAGGNIIHKTDAPSNLTGKVGHR